VVDGRGGAVPLTNRDRSEIAKTAAKLLEFERQAQEQAPRPAARPRPIPPARAARPQKIKGISIFVDCRYSG
jgi:hypothetical protein